MIRGMVSALLATIFVTVYQVPPPPPVTVATYYISPTGSDTNSGTNALSPWATFAKATNVITATATNIPTNIVLFARGGTWRGIQNAHNITNLTVSAYGAGSNPIFYGSVLWTNTWTAHPTLTNVWVSLGQTGAYTDVFCIYTNGSALRDLHSGQASNAGTLASLQVTNNSFVWYPPNVFVSLSENPTNYSVSVSQGFSAPTEFTAGTWNFYRCSNVLIGDIEVRETAYWNGFYGIRFGFSTEMTASNVVVRQFGKHAIVPISCGNTWVVDAQMRDAAPVHGQAMTPYADIGTGLTQRFTRCWTSNCAAFYAHQGGSGFGPNGMVILEDSDIFNGSIGFEDCQAGFIMRRNTIRSTNASTAPVISIASGGNGVWVEGNWFDRQFGVSLTGSSVRTAAVYFVNNVITRGHTGISSLNSWTSGTVNRLIMQGNTIEAVNEAAIFVASGAVQTPYVTLRGNIIAATRAMQYGAGSTNYGSWSNNVFCVNLTNGAATSPSFFTLNGMQLTWTGFVSMGMATASTNTLGVAVTNNFVPGAGSTAIDFIPAGSAAAWGLTNDYFGSVRGTGAVTAGAVEVTP